MPSCSTAQANGLLLGGGVCSNPLYLQQEAKAAQQPMSLSRCQCDPARVTGMLCALGWVWAGGMDRTSPLGGFHHQQQGGFASLNHKLELFVWLTLAVL